MKMNRLKPCLNPDPQNVGVRWDDRLFRSKWLRTNHYLWSWSKHDKVTWWWWWWLRNVWVHIYMKTKIRERCYHWDSLWQECSYILSHCCFSYISINIFYFLESTKELHYWLRTNQNHWTCNLFFLLKVMWKHWDLMGHCTSAQLMCYPQLYHTYLTLRLFLQTIAGGNMEEQT